MGANQLANEFWLSDRQWAALEPLIPTHRRGVKPKRNRENNSGAEPKNGSKQEDKWHQGR